MRLIRNQVYPQGYRGFESLSLRKSNWVTTPDTVVVPRVLLAWRDDRVAEGARLEIVCVERHRGFESRSLRHPSSDEANSYGCGRRNVDEPRQAGNGATVVD